MSFFYVSSVIGTRTVGGGYATAQTGSFATLGATNVYASIMLAIADGASDSDVVCVSDAHAHTTTAQLLYAGGTSLPLYIISVLDSACQTVTLTGGSESVTGGSSDLSITNLIRIVGLTLSTADWFYPSKASGSISIFDNCTINVTGANNSIQASTDGTYTEFNDCVIDLYYNTTEIDLSNATEWVMNGGNFASTISGSLTNLFLNGFDNGGGTVTLNGVDLSVVSGNLFGNIGGALTGDDQIKININGCKMNASVTYNNETFTSKHHKMYVSQSSSSSAAAEYQRRFHTRGGILDESTAFYRDGSQAFKDSAQQVSYKCFADSTAEIAMPFEFELPSTFATLSSASSDTIRINLLCASTLTDADVWAELVYPDGTNKNVFNRLFSVSNPFNPLRTGTGLTTNSEAWTGRTTENRYQIDLDTSVDVGVDCVPTIRVFVTKQSTAIYFCSTVEVAV